MNDHEISLNIARTIIEQLGGNRFKVMTGANNFTVSKSAVSFHFKGSRKVNACRIELNGNDLYDLTFCKLGGKALYKEISSAYDIYNDQLEEIFTKHTSLYTRL